MIVPGILVCNSFLISVCTFIVSKDLLISCAMNPFSTVLFNVCSAVTVECCVLYKCCVGAFGMVAITERGIWACMRCTSLYLCWVWG